MTTKLMALIAVLVLALAACGGGASDTTSSPPAGGPGDPAAGADVYKSTCSACHGSDLQGVSGLGKPLAPSAFVVAETEEGLAAFLAIGRPVDHPENTQGVAMPPRGGNPSLSDQDLLNVAAFLKSRN